ncbi:transcriptional regulator [Candidatus Poribacteria bacterium]|nr:MAG: transcriptional regulator [Candidatus Poribacteria bacterium]
MRDRELREIIEKGEDAFTEFKDERTHPEEIAASLVAFANAQGGRLIIGVSDEGEILGVGDPDAVMQRIDQISFNNCEPPVTCFQEKVKIDDKIVIVVHIPKGGQRPYRTRRGMFFIRTSSGKRQATREELLRIFQEAKALNPDEIPVPGTSAQEIDVRYFGNFFREAFGRRVEEEGVELERILMNMKLMTAEGLLTTAGLLLFGENPQRHLPWAKIHIVRFEGTEISESLLDQKEITGTLFEQLEEAERVLKSHIRVAGRIEGFKREDIYEIPLEALREAVVNAVAHRDYSIRSHIRVFIFDDRVEVRSPGGLPNTVTVENIRYGIHVERNPVIVSFLTKRGFMGQIGTGIVRMIRLMRERVGREPEFYERGFEFHVILPKRRIEALPDRGSNRALGGDGQG